VTRPVIRRKKRAYALYEYFSCVEFGYWGSESIHAMISKLKLLLTRLLAVATFSSSSRRIIELSSNVSSTSSRSSQPTRHENGDGFVTIGRKHGATVPNVCHQQYLGMHVVLSGFVYHSLLVP